MGNWLQASRVESACMAGTKWLCWDQADRSLPVLWEARVRDTQPPRPEGFVLSPEGAQHCVRTLFSDPLQPCGVDKQSSPFYR